MKVVTAAEMRSIEQQVVESGVSLSALMQQAGSALARAAASLAPSEQLITVLVGPGNNGGDGLVAARRLAEEGKRVVVYTFHRAEVDDFAGRVIKAEEDKDLQILAALASGSAVLVDALLGIGQTRPTQGLLADMLECVNRTRGSTTRGLAADIPTGVNADTGQVLGEAFHADVTLAMGFLKYGDVVYPGAQYAGRVEVADVGIHENLAADIPVVVPSRADIAALLPHRAPNSNKGTYGRVLLVGGSRNFIGAPALSSLAAYRSGAGLVEVATPASIQQTVATHGMEPIFEPLPEHDGRIVPEAIPQLKAALQHATALVYGPGMGLADTTIAATHDLLGILPDTQLRGTVIDADGLNALARLEGWWHVDTPMVLTPHPGEMSRLTGLSVEEIQRDRVHTAMRFAQRWGKVVVLKGAATVVADPAGRASINPTGGPNLATAGTGDVLSGVIGGLLAQQLPPFEAAVVGTYLHGTAGDMVASREGSAGTIASDLLPNLPGARQAILAEVGKEI